MSPCTARLDFFVSVFFFVFGSFAVVRFTSQRVSREVFARRPCGQALVTGVRSLFSPTSRLCRDACLRF